MAAKTGEASYSMKCSLCGREYPLYDLLCLNRGRTANAQCREEHHLVLCSDCQKVVYETLKSIMEAEGDESYYSSHFRYPTTHNTQGSGRVKATKVGEFLVFKGDWVWYSSGKRKIKGYSGDDCILIKDVDPELVKADEASVIWWSDGHFLAEGNEIWSDGQRYIIKDRRKE